MDKSFFDLPSAVQSLSVQKIFTSLHSRPNGLTEEEAAERLKIFGKNQLEDDAVRWWVIYLRQFQSILIYVLFAASVVSLALGKIHDFFVILAVVFMNSVIGFWQEGKAERAVRALKKLTQSKTRVERGGQKKTIYSSDLVVGDCVFLQEGELVTADIRLTEETSLMIDEAALTGESIPVVKDSQAVVGEAALAYEWKNMALSGTMVVRGQGKGIVVRTGKETYFASIAQKAAEAAPPSPLTKALHSFSKKYVFGLIFLFFIFWVIGFFQGRPMVELAYIFVASLVSVVPEGLPLMITLVLMISAIALSKKNSLIRILPALETLGSATVIACDKTGTITQGKLMVKEWAGDDINQLQMIAALCNDAKDGSCDPIDLALWHWVPHGKELHKKYPRKWSYPFDAKTMFMAVVHEIDQRDVLLIKGAYESLKKLSIPDEKIEKDFRRLLAQGYRVLAFGMGDWNGSAEHHLWKIKIVGLVGFLDPPKEGVREAVAIAKEAHIRVMMLTGDHPETAKSIAQEVGIWSEGDTVIVGKEIEEKSHLARVQRASVLARILPEHKYEIVKLLQQNHEIVAVTGDGVNDVPALRAADLGIAMGSGTEAAKAVSAIILTDNNFRVIVEAIKRGRVITDNLRKILYYLLSTSLQEISLIAFSIFAFFPIPLTAIQILWINLVTDGVQAQCFSCIKEEGDVMKRRPQKPSEKFFDSIQMMRILTFGFAVGGFIFVLYSVLLSQLSFVKTSSIIFTCTVAAQWANGIQSQKEREPFFKNFRRSLAINPLIFAGISAGLALQLIALYVFPSDFSSEPLTWNDWLYPATTFLFAFTFVEIRKWVEYLWKYNSSV